MDVRITLLCLLMSATASAGDVLLYSRQQSLAPQVIDTFTAQTGHTVTQLHYDNVAIRDQVVRTGRARGFDLLMMDSVSTRVLATDGHLMKLPATQIRDEHDCGQFGMPLAEAPLGLAYRASLMAPPRSWQALFSADENLRDRVVLGNDPVNTYAAALLADGLDPFSQQEGELRRALARIEKLRPFHTELDNPLTIARQQGQESTMALALVYAGEEHPLRRLTGHDDWQFVVPDNGSILWRDCMVAPKDKVLTSATRDLLAYLAQPEVLRRNALLTGYPMSVKDHSGADNNADRTAVIPGRYANLTANALRIRARLMAHLTKKSERR